MKKPVIVIFDFDGVIADSVGALYEVYLDFMSGLGIKGTPAEFESLNGLKLSEIVSRIRLSHTIKDDHQVLYDRYLCCMDAAYARINLNDGVQDLLDVLRRRKIPIALASSSRRSAIEAVFERFDLKHYFDYIVTGDDVSQAKPSPEIYNAVKARFPGYDYYVVEDSDNGIQAAVDAGMKVLFYNPGNRTTRLPATRHVQSLNDVTGIVGEIELGCFTIARAEKILLRTVSFSPGITPTAQERIDRIWNRESGRRQLSNGKVVCLKSHEQSGNRLLITCFVTEYKYVLASIVQPGLLPDIKPIGVSGFIVDTRENTLLAVRQNVTEYSGRHELVPSGSIEAHSGVDHDLDFSGQLLRELEEETGIVSDDVIAVEPVCLVYDAHHGVYDICCRILIQGHIEELIPETMSREYRNFKVIGIRDLAQSLSAVNLIPTSQVFFANSLPLFQ